MGYVINPLDLSLTQACGLFYITLCEKLSLGNLRGQTTWLQSERACWPAVKLAIDPTSEAKCINMY